MRPVEQSADNYFSEAGFVKFDQFLSPEQLKALRDLYEQTRFGDHGGRMYSNIQDLGLEQNVRIENSIIDICTPSLDNYLSGYKIVGASFIIKGPGRESDSRLHQDWTIVDETRYRSALLWIPLVDVDESNGCLKVLPGSHRWFHTLRSSTVSSLFLRYNSFLDTKLTTVPMHAGSAALFYMKLFHGSKQNLSGKDRPAVTLTLMDKDAKYIHCVMQPDHTVKIIECNKEFTYSHAFYLNDPASADRLSVIEVVRDPEKYILKQADFYRKLETVSPAKGIRQRFLRRLNTLGLFDLLKT